MKIEVKITRGMDFFVAEMPMDNDVYKGSGSELVEKSLVNITERLAKAVIKELKKAQPNFFIDS